MNNKVINSLSILCLIAIIGVMSWRDMHPKNAVDTSMPLGVVTYYAGPDITPAMIPDDSKPITIDLGDFSYAPNGKVVWTPHGMPPTTFAQRQVNLQFNFKSLSQDPAETIEKIKNIAGGWRQKGDTVSLLILNYRAADGEKQANLKAYTALLGKAHDQFGKPDARNLNRYMVFASINPLWSERALKNLQEYSPQFLVHLPQTHISPEMLSKLTTLNYNLILQYPPGTRMEDIDMTAIRKIRSLSGVTLMLDAHKPLPKKEEKVGLFPKL